MRYQLFEIGYESGTPMLHGYYATRKEAEERGKRFPGGYHINVLQIVA